MSAVPQEFIELIRGLNTHSGDRVMRYLVAKEINELYRYVYHNPASLTELWRHVHP